MPFPIRTFAEHWSVTIQHESLPWVYGLWSIEMVETGLNSMPVMQDGMLVGEVSLDDLLQARTKNLEEEQSHERVLHLKTPFRPSGEQIEPLQLRLSRVMN